MMPESVKETKSMAARASSRREEEATRELGVRVLGARERKRWSQAELANQLNNRLGRQKPDQIGQSYIARIERGSALPSREILEAIAAVLPVTYGELVGAVLRDRYLSKDCAALAYPLEKGLVTLHELALWEQRPDHEEVWVVAEQFVDHHLRDFYSAVSTVVRRGGTFVFFLPSEQGGHMKRYEAQIAHEAAMQGGGQQIGKLRHVPLTDHQRSLMATPFVVANPNTPGVDRDGESFPNGYTILADNHGEPCLGLRMANQECRALVNWLRTFKFDVENEESVT